MKIDQLIRSRRKTVALIIERDGRLVVRAPLKLALFRIQEFVDQKAGWVERKRLQIQQAASQVPASQAAPHQYRSGEIFWYLGRQYPLQIVPGMTGIFHQEEAFYLGKGSQPNAQAVFTDWYKEQARVVLAERVQEYSGRYGFTYTKLRISSARTRWGSCSTRGTLSFSWRLVMAPLEVIDYVVVHELVHLQIRNHSKSFWARVQEIMPDYQTRRDWLKNVLPGF